MARPSVSRVPIPHTVARCSPCRLDSHAHPCMHARAHTHHKSYLGGRALRVHQLMLGWSVGGIVSIDTLMRVHRLAFSPPLCYPASRALERRSRRSMIDDMGWAFFESAQLPSLC